MALKIVYAGNKGENIRSDCFVALEIMESGGRHIDVQSKVDALYGKSIHELLHDMLVFFGLEHVRLKLEDTGALPLVIAARVEAAIQKSFSSNRVYLLPLIRENQYDTKKDQFRISRLYLPGNTPKMMINAGIHHPNGIILDLEDSVAPEKKHEARILVRNALRGINFYGAERMVRINQVPDGLEDLKYVVPHNVHVILIPKCEDAGQVLQVEREINRIQSEHRLNNQIYLMPVIESALGVEKAFNIAGSSQNVVALAIGLEDYTADIGTRRSIEAHESLYARARLVNACKASGIQPIDSVFSDVDDEEGLRASVDESKSLGFEGMGCIHPRQIRIIHQGFAPGGDEIEKARRIVHAYVEAREKGLGVVALGSKMIDLPVVNRAQRTLKLAKDMGLIYED